MIVFCMHRTRQCQDIRFTTKCSDIVSICITLGYLFALESHLVEHIAQKSVKKDTVFV